MPTHRISGSFDVKMQPQPDDTLPAPLGRAGLDKRYHGDLAATGQGQMLSAISATPGSAGYVAIELVTGSLLGKAGSFVLQHSGLMDRGAQQLSITVVPDSATGELAGLAGQMDIRINDGKHFYCFNCTFPDQVSRHGTGFAGPSADGPTGTEGALAGPQG